MTNSSISLEDVAKLIGAEIVGDPDARVISLGTLRAAEQGDLTHLSNNAYKKYLPSTRASAVILAKKEVRDCPTNALVVNNPKQAFAKASHLFVKTKSLEKNFVHQSAVVPGDAQVGKEVHIASNVVIGSNALIGSQSYIHANTVMGDRVKIGQETVIMPNVTLYDDVVIGDRTTVHSGAVIGADGFGFEPSDGSLSEPVAQIGGVQIGSDVSIGACTCIDCGAIDDTVVGNGVKIDNQVQVGHNCIIGDNTIICGQVGIVGSTTIGRNCILAGGAGIGGAAPIELCDGVVVSARATVTQSILVPGLYSGVAPYMEHKKWLRNSRRYKDLDALFKRVKILEKK